ncbi:glutathione S-transferase [Fennellomyces sp. T-0311]|nr:glutathione S-transferase [Fennellomyces sp. T-0311]
MLKEIYLEARIPIIKYGDDVIPESMVIVELIHELYPTAKLYPTDPVKKAKMKAIIRLVEDKILQIIRILYSGPITRETFDMFEEGVTAVYSRINGQLVDQAPSGPYFLGTEYSAADIAIAPFVYLLTNFVYYAAGRDYKVVDELPRLSEFLNDILENPTFKETCLETEDDLKARIGPRFGLTQNMFSEP